MIIDIFVAFIGIITIMNPIGTTFILHSMTKNDSVQFKTKLINRAILSSFIILALFYVAGPLLLDLFGISTYAFSVAGGVYLLRVSLGMLGQNLWKNADDYQGATMESAIVPLSVPLVAGPGTMTAVIALSDGNGFFIMIPAIICSLVLAWLLFYNSRNIVYVFGDMGSKVIERIFGLILLAISAELIFSGIAEFAASNMLESK